MHENVNSAALSFTKLRACKRTALAGILSLFEGDHNNGELLSRGRGWGLGLLLEQEGLWVGVREGEVQ